MASDIDALRHDATVFTTRRIPDLSPIPIRDTLTLRHSAGPSWELGDTVNVLEGRENNTR
jgi:hypothetical protein